MAATFYSQILHGWDWEGIARDCKAAIAGWREKAGNLNDPQTPLDEIEVDDGFASAALDPMAFPSRVIKSCGLIGTWTNMAPSGRFYAPWSAVESNVRERDAAYAEALEKAANKFGLSIENGEGDPLDTFACMYEDID